MRVDIPTVKVQTPSGEVLCKQADVSFALSESVAMRVVPVGPDGTEYPEATQAMLIPARDSMRDPQMKAFWNAIGNAAKNLLRDRGK
jgi:hypothetical protein